MEKSNQKVLGMSGLQNEREGQLPGLWQQPDWSNKFGFIFSAHLQELFQRAVMWWISVVTSAARGGGGVTIPGSRSDFATWCSGHGGVG